MSIPIRVTLCSTAALLLASCGVREAGSIASHGMTRLSVSPLTLTEKSTVLQVRKQLDIESDTRLCLILAQGVAYDSRDHVDVVYSEALGDAVPSATLRARDGTTLLLTELDQGWVADANGTRGEGEVLGCLSSPSPLPTAFKVDSIELRSTGQLQVLGMYWTSMPQL